MQDRIDNVQETTAQLEPPPPEMQKAITAGTDANQQAGIKYIEEKKKQSGLSRFGE